jgi:para-nitrobenzyl esterase
MREGRYQYVRVLCGVMLSIGVGVVDAADPTVVVTAYGKVQGVDTGSEYLWKGLPYAAPPTAKQRWKPPSAPASWSGVRDASSFAPHCAQLASDFGSASDSEDCLYLNVYAPKTPGPHPVMLWIHGGSLVVGQGELYDPTPLVERDVVVVTINYRLGALGYMALPALSNASGYAGSGNYGFMDQQAALRWVQGNIAGFGGDPAKVTVFGESAGALSTLVHLVSPLSAGLAQRAIVESGAYGMATPTLKTAQNQGKSLATALGCSASSISCLQKVPVANILAAQAGNYNGNIDGYLLPESLGSAVNAGHVNTMPVMIGSNHDEYTLFVAYSADLNPAGGPVTADNYTSYLNSLAIALGKKPQKVDKQYPTSKAESLSLNLAAIGTDGLYACNSLDVVAALSQFVPVYMYEFSDPDAPPLLPPVSFPYRAYHSAEIQYFMHFGSADFPSFTSAQQALSQQMIGYWSGFALNGNPGGSGVAAWPAYTAASTKFQSLAPDAVAAKGGFDDAHQCSFW